MHPKLNIDCANARGLRCGLSGRSLHKLGRLVVLLSQDDKLKNGGAALMAYARMQFEVMSDYERGELQNALRKYCELDTLAMVMIVEAWRDKLKLF
ncbi:hypothetical protein OAH99_01775 [Planktomarina sp.]|nr:hypothetical protein [Planktomarina sp.]